MLYRHIYHKYVHAATDGVCVCILYIIYTWKAGERMRMKWNYYWYMWLRNWSQGQKLWYMQKGGSKEFSRRICSTPPVLGLWLPLGLLGPPRMSKYKEMQRKHTFWSNLRKIAFSKKKCVTSPATSMNKKNTQYFCSVVWYTRNRPSVRPTVHPSVRASIRPSVRPSVREPRQSQDLMEPNFWRRH